MRKVLYRSVIISFLMASIIIVFNPSTEAQGGCTIAGNIFRDFDASGADDGTLEPGVEGLIVNAYGDDDMLLSSAMSDRFGDYTLAIPEPFARLELEIPATSTFLKSGPFGADMGTSLTMLDCTNIPAGGVDFGVNDPSQFCHPNPDITTACYVFGDQIAGANNNLAVVVTFPYESGSTSFFANSIPQGPPIGQGAFIDGAYTTDAVAMDVGAVWGMAYQPISETVFAGSFIKRHVSLGPTGNPGTIYSIDRTTGTVAPYVTLSAGADPHTPINTVNVGLPPYFDDIGAFNAIGRVGLADIDFSNDTRFLYAVNLSGNGSLHRLFVDAPALPAPTAAGIFSFPVPVTGVNGVTQGCAQGFLRPGGIKFYDGNLYAGLTCTGPTVDELRAYVYSFSPVAGAFGAGPVAEVDLRYQRGCVSFDGTDCAAAEWQPWAVDTNNNTDDDLLFYPPFGQFYYPQPWLMDIEFDEFGYMILGILDRAGHQLGNNQGGAGAGPAEAAVAGDVIRLDPYTTPGIFTLEDNGQSGPIGEPGAATSISVGTGEGPGGGEFYFGDRFQLFQGVPDSGTHHEITLAGLTSIYGRGEIVVTAYDPAARGDALTGGIIMMGHDDGERSRSIQVFERNAPGTFGKAAGMADVENICYVPPLEIGNRVWEDLDLDGRQDPEEAVFGPGGLGAVRLSLYLDTDGDGVTETLVAQTDTDANGEYIFSGATIEAYLAANGLAPVAGVHYFDFNGNNLQDPQDRVGILPLSNYEVRIDDPMNYGGGPLTPYYATVSDSQLNVRDSDGIVPSPIAFVSNTNVPVARVATGLFGENDHTFDFGFALLPPPIPPTPAAGNPQLIENEPTLSVDRLNRITTLPNTGERSLLRRWLAPGLLMVSIFAVALWSVWLLRRRI